jgi:hypothetical protein
VVVRLNLRSVSLVFIRTVPIGYRRRLTALRLFARALGLGLLLLAALVPLCVALLLWVEAGPEALVALGPAGWVALGFGLVLPGGLGLLALCWLTQRAELVVMRDALQRQGESGDSRALALQALLAEAREQTAILQEQTRLLLGQLGAVRGQAETLQALMSESRLERLVAEWDMTARELAAVMAAMWRLAFGWRRAEGEVSVTGAGEGADIALPAGPELALAILRLLPATTAEMARFEVDERFVRQAAHYRAVFRRFLERVPETGPLNRGLFRDMVQGRLDARLALLPRPNHALVIPADTLAAE